MTGKSGLNKMLAGNQIASGKIYHPTSHPFLLSVHWSIHKHNWILPWFGLRSAAKWPTFVQCPMDLSMWKSNDRPCLNYLFCNGLCCKGLHNVSTCTLTEIMGGMWAIFTLVHSPVGITSPANKTLGPMAIILHPLLLNPFHHWGWVRHTGHSCS